MRLVFDTSLIKAKAQELAKTTLKHGQASLNTGLTVTKAKDLFNEIKDTYKKELDKLNK